MEKHCGPNIFEYDDYRAYLHAYYIYAKKLDRGFSFRVFARRAGFTSPNFLKLVIQGKRNLAPESVEKFTRALRLKKNEAVFFSQLVGLNQAKAPELKNQYARKILNSRASNKFHPLRKEQFEYYSRWYSIPIRELAGLPGFLEDPKWIAGQIISPITPEEAKIAFDNLIKLNLLTRHPSGQITQTEAVVVTDDEVSAFSVGQFHREMLKRAAESISAIPAKEREISAVTLGLSPETAKRVKTILQNMRKRILEIAAQEEMPSRVYEINFRYRTGFNKYYIF